MPLDNRPNKEQVIIGNGYPTFQLAKALRNSILNVSPSSERKIEQWEKVLLGMYSGELQIGSRTPVSGTSSWATLEVATGGFATGQLLAGGDLTDYEKDLAEQLNIPLGPETRALLNGYFISQEGVQRLRDHASTGQFTVNLPEEGALLAVACLIDKGDSVGANEVLSHIFPYFAELRFFPNLQGQENSSESVFLQSVGETINKLGSVQTSRQVRAQDEAVNVWIPLYDSLVSLLVETIAGEIPSVEIGQSGNHKISGGYPGQKLPDGWVERARVVIALHEENASQHKLCGRRLKQGSAHQRFLKATQSLVESQNLPAGDQQYIRLQLARYIAKRGLPGSAQHNVSRGTQTQECRGPKYRDIAELLGRRLSALPKDQGIENISFYVAPILTSEASNQVPEGTCIPKHIVKKVGRAQIATVDELIQQGYITSADVLAEVLPQMTSGVRAASFTDIRLKRVYMSVYRAFRRRRSLLLINFESQVKITELPWILEIEKFRATNLADREPALVVLNDVLVLALSHFPQALLPNKLLQEIRALLDQAGLDVPIVDEVAADIFMGRFTQKYSNSATIASDLLSDTTYAKYYNIDYVALSKRLQKSLGGEEFSKVCAERVVAESERWSVARNGVVIEQQQILTTQNLAVVFHKLNLLDLVKTKLPGMIENTFSWICRRQQVPIDNYHAGLIMLKNTAYAWRQMVFYLSLLPHRDQVELLSWMFAHFNKQGIEFRNRFKPVMNGLKAAIAGKSITRNDPESLMFLGWTVDRHPLMPEKRV